MNWKIFFKKILTYFLIGGAASLSEETAKGNPPKSPEELLQHSILGLITALLGGITNWLKHKDNK